MYMYVYIYIYIYIYTYVGVRQVSETSAVDTGSDRRA